MEIDLTILPHGKRMITEPENFILWFKSILGECEVKETVYGAKFKLTNGEVIKFNRNKGTIKLGPGSQFNEDKIYSRLWLYDEVKTDYSYKESSLLRKLRKTLLRDILIFLVITLIFVYLTGSLRHIPDIVWYMNGAFAFIRLLLIRIIDHRDNKKGITDSEKQD